MLSSKDEIVLDCIKKLNALISEKETYKPCLTYVWLLSDVVSAMIKKLDFDF